MVFQDLKSPLHVAAEKGQGEAMEYLLMCGGDPNLKDKVNEELVCMCLKQEISTQVFPLISANMLLRLESH